VVNKLFFLAAVERPGIAAAAELRIARRHTLALRARGARNLERANYPSWSCSTSSGLPVGWSRAGAAAAFSILLEELLAWVC